MRTETKSLFWAASLSPLAVIPASVAVALWSAVEDARKGNMAASTLIRETLSEAAVMSVLAIPTAYVMMLAIGVPTALLALRLKRTWLLAAITVGGLCGLAIGLVVSSPDSDHRSLAIWYGVAVSVAFWLLFKRRAARSQDVPSSHAA